jgi:hypothetical protein
VLSERIVSAGREEARRYELPDEFVVRVPLDGVGATRQVILVVRAGEETVPRIAVAIEAPREVSQTWLTSRGQSEP